MILNILMVLSLFVVAPFFKLKTEKYVDQIVLTKVYWEGYYVNNYKLKEELYE